MLRRHRLTALEDENPCSVHWRVCWTILPGNGDVTSTWAHSPPVLCNTWANFLWEWFKDGQTLQGRKVVIKQISSTFSVFADAFWESLASVYSGNCSSFPPILLSGYFLLLKLWLPREQLAWTVSSSESPVSSLFSYLQSSLNEDTKSLAHSQIRKPISYLCIPCYKGGIIWQL